MMSSHFNSWYQIFVLANLWNDMSFEAYKGEKSRLI